MCLYGRGLKESMDFISDISRKVTLIEQLFLLSAFPPLSRKSTNHARDHSCPHPKLIFTQYKILIVSVAQLHMSYM